MNAKFFNFKFIAGNISLKNIENIAICENKMY